MRLNRMSAYCDCQFHFFEFYYFLVESLCVFSEACRDILVGISYI